MAVKWHPASTNEDTTTVDPQSVTEMLIVAAGGILTLLIGGALLYWIEKEWRDLDARQRGRGQPAEDADLGRRCDDPASGQPPQS